MSYASESSKWWNMSILAGNGLTRYEVREISSSYLLGSHIKSNNHLQSGLYFLRVDKVTQLYLNKDWLNVYTYEASWTKSDHWSIIASSVYTEWQQLSNIAGSFRSSTTWMCDWRWQGLHIGLLYAKWCSTTEPVLYMPVQLILHACVHRTN